MPGVYVDVVAVIVYARHDVRCRRGMMYTSHFGLAELPFSITPDPRFLYMSERHREALAHLLYGIGEGGGFVQLTGEVGTGKTTVCRCLLEQVPPQVDIALILNPKLTAPELLATVCDELRVAYPPGTASLKVLVDVLYRHLLDAHGRGRRTVLIIDEAQNLSSEVLEQVRLLTNLETPTEKLLQIILIGQPELARLLQRDDLRQLAQRVTARYHLQPFSPSETSGYIRHRLAVAGQKQTPFTESAMREVHRLAGGVPRLINVIGDRALLGAYAEERRVVDARTVRRAAGEVLGRSVRPRLARPLLWSSVAVAALAAVTATWVGLGAGRELASPLFRWPPAAATVAASGPALPERTVTATPAPAPAAEEDGDAPGVRLGDVLADPALAGDKRTAFTSLYARWGLAYDSKAALACEGTRPDGMQCLFKTGTWTKLRRIDLPAVMELATPDGARHYATLTALGEQTAMLRFGARALTVPLAEVERFWEGTFIVLWKAPPLRNLSIAPGARGKDVEWLRRRLAELDGKAPPAKGQDLYDDGLRERVVAFQRSRGLLPDGIVGAETLTHLSTALHEPGIPLLSAAKP